MKKQIETIPQSAQWNLFYLFIDKFECFREINWSLQKWVEKFHERVTNLIWDIRINPKHNYSNRFEKSINISSFIFRE